MEHYRIYNDCGLYYVTFSVVAWLPVFVSEAAFQILVDSLNYCHEHKFLRTNAFVIMPTHFHAIIFDSEWNAARLDQSLTDFRKFTGRRLADHCATNLPACFSQTLKHSAPKDRDRRFWQATRHPVALTSEEMWHQKLDYLHDNPRRKGLVRRAEDWRYSSADYYLTDGANPSEVQIARLSWD